MAKELAIAALTNVAPALISGRDDVGKATLALHGCKPSRHRDYTAQTLTIEAPVPGPNGELVRG